MTLPPNSRGEEWGVETGVRAAAAAAAPSRPRVQASSLEVWREAWGPRRAGRREEGNDGERGAPGRGYSTRCLSHPLALGLRAPPGVGPWGREEVAAVHPSLAENRQQGEGRKGSQLGGRGKRVLCSKTTGTCW